MLFLKYVIYAVLPQLKFSCSLAFFRQIRNPRFSGLAKNMLVPTRLAGKHENYQSANPRPYPEDGHGKLNLCVMFSKH